MEIITVVAFKVGDKLFESKEAAVLQAKSEENDAWLRAVENFAAKTMYGTITKDDLVHLVVKNKRDLSTLLEWEAKINEKANC